MAIRKNIEKEHMKRYQMVRFFERKKAERRYKRAQKLNPDEKISAVHLDLLYIIVSQYCPLEFLF